MAATASQPAKMVEVGDGDVAALAAALRAAVQAPRGAGEHVVSFERRRNSVGLNLGGASKAEFFQPTLEAGVQLEGSERQSGILRKERCRGSLESLSSVRPTLEI